MNLPRAVVEAERLADEALQQRYAPQQQPDPAQTGELQTPPTENVSAPPATATESVPATTTPTEGDDKWEARYKTLNGKYSAEVPRLHAALKERESTLKSLTDEVEALKRSVSKESLVKPEEVQEYGEPLVDLMRRAAREEMSAKDAELESLKRKVDSFEVKTVANNEASFYENLASNVPDWMAINDDPAFHAWLAEYDDLTGYQRQQILSEAEGKRDAVRVAKFFNTYKQVQNKTAASASNSLESQVAPVSSKADVPQQGKKLWTRAEVADFYARSRRGAFTEAQADAIETDIQLALGEGRIR